MSAGKSIQQAADEGYLSRFDSETVELIAAAEGYAGLRYEEALEELQEQPLSIDKVATYWQDEVNEWEILLGTGGPADRIVVRTDFSGTVESAEYQFQDWFEPWTAAQNQDATLVKRYAEIVGYYEG